MHPRLPHIMKLVKHSSRIKISTPTTCLEHETKMEAIEYLLNDEGIDFNIFEIDEDESIIIIEAKQ